MKKVNQAILKLIKKTISILKGYFLIVVLVILVFIIWGAYLRFEKGLVWADWTGFEDQTLWELMKLIIVPALLAVGAYWLNIQLKIRDEQRERIGRRETEWIEENRQKESTLQKYLDDMSALLLDKDKRKELLELDEKSAVRDIA